MERPITNRLINDDITITNLDIVQASWVCAHPCFVLDRSSLAAKIRKRNQITFTTFATSGKCVLHESPPSFSREDCIRLPYHGFQARLGDKDSRGGASATASASPQHYF